MQVTVTCSPKTSERSTNTTTKTTTKLSRILPALPRSRRAPFPPIFSVTPDVPTHFTPVISGRSYVCGRAQLWAV